MRALADLSTPAEGLNTIDVLMWMLEPKHEL